jgi:hypothetical protein
MSYPMYNIHTRMPEQLAFNQTIYSYLNSSHNLCYRIKKMYMQIFRLVNNIATAISWLTTPEHSCFDKHELRQIKHLMGDLMHPHIFTAMLASAGQYLIFLF